MEEQVSQQSKNEAILVQSDQFMEKSQYPTTLTPTQFEQLI